ncbi:hypothetical protein LCGC14_0569860 [marine sediment metagenome]|uniref:Uncharacterized protein n=1 Tax=marine sediment metagenome TaxID=412755 RepID=A0A0F9RPL0_9ZZZZ
MGATEGMGAFVGLSILSVLVWLIWSFIIWNEASWGMFVWRIIFIGIVVLSLLIGMGTD